MQRTNSDPLWNGRNFVIAIVVIGVAMSVFTPQIESALKLVSGAF